MASVSNAQSRGPSFSNAVELVRVIYDFAIDGGATGDLTLLTSVGATVVKLKYMRVVTAVTSGGSLTLDLGKTSGDEFFADIAVANLTLDSMHLAVATTGVVELTDGEVVAMGIIAAAATAGKMEFVFEVIKK